MTDDKKIYQLICLFSPQIDQERLKQTTEKIKNWVAQQSSPEERPADSTGLSDQNILVRKQLAYPIKGQREAFMFCFDFSLAPEKINDLHQFLRPQMEIIRHLVSIKGKAETQPFADNSAWHHKLNFNFVDKIESLKSFNANASTNSHPAPDSPAQAKEENKVAIDKLDEKLEQILNQ